MDAFSICKKNASVNHVFNLQITLHLLVKGKTCMLDFGRKCAPQRPKCAATAKADALPRITSMN